MPTPFPQQPPYCPQSRYLPFRMPPLQPQPQPPPLLQPQPPPPLPGPRPFMLPAIRAKSHGPGGFPFAPSYSGKGAERHAQQAAPPHTAAFFADVDDDDDGDGEERFFNFPIDDSPVDEVPLAQHGVQPLPPQRPPPQLNGKPTATSSLPEMSPSGSNEANHRPHTNAPTTLPRLSNEGTAARQRSSDGQRTAVQEGGNSQAANPCDVHRDGAEDEVRQQWRDGRRPLAVAASGAAAHLGPRSEEELRESDYLLWEVAFNSPAASEVVKPKPTSVGSSKEPPVPPAEAEKKHGGPSVTAPLLATPVAAADAKGTSFTKEDENDLSHSSLMCLYSFNSLPVMKDAQPQQQSSISTSTSNGTAADDVFPQSTDANRQQRSQSGSGKVTTVDSNGCVLVIQHCEYSSIDDFLERIMTASPVDYPKSNEDTIAVALCNSADSLMSKGTPPLLRKEGKPTLFVPNASADDTEKDPDYGSVFPVNPKALSVKQKQLQEQYQLLKWQQQQQQLCKDPPDDSGAVRGEAKKTPNFSPYASRQHRRAMRRNVPLPPPLSVEILSAAIQKR